MKAKNAGGQPELSLATQFTRISQELLTEPEQEPTLDRIVQLAVETVTSAEACGVSLRRPDHTVDTPACTSPLVQRLDDLQYRLKEGPALDSVWTLDINLIDNMNTEQRWPAWAPRAAQLGVASALSVRIETSTDVIGSLNLYAHEPRAFDETDIAVASIFARYAASALVIAGHAENLNAALRTRQAIGVAQGMLMQRYRLTLDQSFEVLRRYSQEHNVKVRDLAEQLVVAGRIVDGLDETLEG